MCIQINNLFKKAATIKLPIVFILYTIMLPYVVVYCVCQCLSNKSFSLYIPWMDGRTAIIGFFVCLLAFFLSRACAQLFVRLLSQSQVFPENMSRHYNVPTPCRQLYLHKYIKMCNFCPFKKNFGATML